MREIKFRGKIKDKKSLLFNRWVYGYLFRFSGRYVISDNFDIGYGWTKDYCNVDENAVGQFTGLYDKNGTEIYEGDILNRYGFQTWYVAYENGGFKSVSIDCVQRTNWNHLPLEKEFVEHWEIIGNIHDNPELLKEQ